MSTLEIASPRWLLVKTCQDLVAKSTSTDVYSKLRMAGLLRHLLSGPHALVDRVAKEAETSFEFWFREPDVDGSAWTSAEGFDASRRVIAGSSGQVRKTGKAELVGARVVHCGGWYTVDQLIGAVDHFYGGAPASALEGVSRPAMVELDRSIRSGSADVPIALQEVSGVVLRALLPIAKSHQPADGAVRAEKPAPMAPSGSGCPFSGKIDLSRFEGE